MMGLRRLEGKDAIELILSVLRRAVRPMTTREVQEETKKRMVRCPDSTAVFLNKLRLSGLIKGERSSDKREWIWWVED